MNYQASNVSFETPGISLVVEWLTIIRKHILLIPFSISVALVSAVMVQIYWPPAYIVEAAIFLKSNSGHDLDTFIHKSNLVNVDMALQRSFRQQDQLQDILPPTNNIITDFGKNSANVNQDADRRDAQLSILTKLAKSTEFRMKALSAMVAKGETPEKVKKACSEPSRCADRVRVSVPRGKTDLVFIKYKGRSKAEAEAALGAIISNLQATAKSLAISNLASQIEDEKNRAELWLQNIQQFSELANLRTRQNEGILKTQETDVRQLAMSAIRSEIDLLSSINIAKWVGEPLHVTSVESAELIPYVKSPLFLAIAAVLGLITGVLACYGLHLVSLVKRAFVKNNLLQM